MSVQPVGTPRRTATPGPRTRPDRPPLEVVPAARGRSPKAPFVVLVLTLLTGGLLTLLLVNTALAQGAFALHALQTDGRTLTERQQALSEQLARAQEPAALAARARALGMVPGGPPAFLRLPDGAVLGVPRAAAAAAPAVSAAPVAGPTPTAAAKTAAKRTVKPTGAKPAGAKPTAQPIAKRTGAKPAGAKPTAHATKGTP